MRNILVIRFGALGDLCVLGWSLARLADRTAGHGDRVTLVTKAAFAPLMTGMRGVDEVITLDNGDLRAVRELASTLGARPWDLVLDAHNILRSHLLLAALGRRPDARLAKDTAARLAFMAFGRTSSRLGLRMRDRFDEVCAAATPLTGDPATLPPLAANAAPRDSRLLGLAPGARWDTKRWPEDRFAAVLREHRIAGGKVRIFLGPREQEWFADSELAAAARHDDGVTVVADASLPEVAAALAGVGALVTNDSGLLHVAEAVGTPVVALFGPTVREFGYFPLLADSRVLEVPLECRPCSRNGKRPCHRQDLACLRRITPESVLDAARLALGKEARS